MNDKTFVLLSNQFKRECDQLKKQQKIQTKFEAAQKFRDGLARFNREVEGQVDIITFEEKTRKKRSDMVQ